MAKPIRRSLARRLGRNIGDRRRAVGLTQEQLAEYLEIDTLTVSRYETGNILPPLTVVDVVARLLNTTIADLLGEAPVQPVEHADRIGIWLASLPLSDRDWIEGVVKQLVDRCQPRKRGRPRNPLLIPHYVLDGWTTSLPVSITAAQIIELYCQHATHEQFHAEFKTAPVRHPAQRRRIRTVMQEMIYKAARLIRHAGRWVLGLGEHDSGAEVFAQHYRQLVTT